MRALLITLALTTTLSLFPARADEACVGSPSVVIDQDSGVATFCGYKLRVTLSPVKATEVPLRPGDRLKVVIKKANRLTYDYDKDVKEGTFVDKEALFKYLGGLNEGIPLLLKTAARREGAGIRASLTPPTVEEALENTTLYLAALAKALGEQAQDLAARALYLERLQTLVLDALQRSEDVDGTGGPARVKDLLDKASAWRIPASAADFKASIEAQRAAIPELLFRHYQKVNEVAEALPKALAAIDGAGTRSAELAAEIMVIEKEIKEKTGAAKKAKTPVEITALNKRANALRAESARIDRAVIDLKSVIADIEKGVAQLPQEAPDLYRGFSLIARQISDLVTYASGTSPEEFDEVMVTQIDYAWDKVADVTVTASRKPALADKLAFRQRHFEKITFRVSPEWIVQPAIGAGLIWADALVFDSAFDKTKVGEATTLTATKRTDSRFQLFPLISLAPRGLSRLGSWYEGGGTSSKVWPKSGWAVTIDLGWNFKTDSPAYLAGVSLVFWKQLKLGGGVVWQRREVPNGTSVGQPIGADELIPLRDSYPPSPYIMFSILGWPPFTSGN